MHSILTCPTVAIQDDELVGTFDLEKLGTLLTYWDEIEVISHEHSPVYRDGHLEFLRSAGVAKFINVRGGLPLTDSITGAHDSALPRDINFRKFQAELHYDVLLKKFYRERYNVSDKVVAFEEPSWGMRLSATDAMAASVLQMTLHECLPRPSGEADFEDILKFKRNRKDELARLRGGIQSLVRSIQDDPEPKRAIHYAKDEIQNALLDLQKSAKETGLFKRSLGYLTVTSLACLASEYTEAFGNITTEDLATLATVMIGTAETMLVNRLNTNNNEQKISCYNYANNATRIKQL